MEDYDGVYEQKDEGLRINTHSKHTLEFMKKYNLTPASIYEDKYMGVDCI